MVPQWIVQPFSEADSNFLNIRGEYIVRVIDELGCFAEDTMYLNVNDTVKADAGPDQVLCYNDTLWLEGRGLDTVGNGKSGVYRWYDLGNQPPSFMGTFTRKDFIARDTNDYELQLFVTEGGVQCFDDDTVHVTVNPLPVITLKPNFSVCCDYGVVNLNFNGLTGSDPTGGTWSVPTDPNLVSGNSFYPSRGCLDGISNAKFVHYTYTIPTTGCVNSDSIRITINPLPRIKLDTPTFCQDLGSFSMEQEIVAIPGNTNNGTQEWRCIDCNGNAFDDFVTVNEPVPGVTNFTVHVDADHYVMENANMDTIVMEYTFTNPFGCENTDTAVFYIVKVPTIRFGGPRPLCWDEGEFNLTELSATTPKGGYWEVLPGAGYRNPAALGGIPDSVTINTFNSTELAPGATTREFLIRYTHTLTGCPISKDTVLVINPRPRITLPDLQDVYCETEPVFALNATPTGGTWTSTQPAVLTGGAPRQFDASKSDPGVPITLTYYFKNTTTGCDNSDSLVVETEAAPVIELPADTNLCRIPGQSIVQKEVTLVRAENLPGAISWQQIGSPGSSIVKSADNGNTVTFDLKMANDTTHSFLIRASSGFISGECDPVFDVMNVYLHPIPDAEAFPSEPSSCEPLTTDFLVNVNNTVDPNTASYEWTLGNGVTSNDASPVGIRYDVPGRTDVTLILTSDRGCDTTLSTSVDVYPIPVAKFTPNPNNFTTAALPRFSFNNESEVTDELGSTIADNRWDFGDELNLADTSHDESPTWFYETDTNTYEVLSGGNYQLRLYGYLLLTCCCWSRPDCLHSKCLYS